MSLVKKKPEGLGLKDWMLAIDFDAVEIKSARFAELEKRVVVLDINAIRLDKGD